MSINRPFNWDERIACLKRHVGCHGGIPKYVMLVSLNACHFGSHFGILKTSNPAARSHGLNPEPMPDEARLVSANSNECEGRL